MSYIILTAEQVRDLAYKTIDNVWRKRAEAYIIHNTSFFRKWFTWIGKIENPSKEEVIFYLKARKAEYDEQTHLSSPPNFIFLYSDQEITALKLLVAAKYSDTIYVSLDDLMAVI